MVGGMNSLRYLILLNIIVECVNAVGPNHVMLRTVNRAIHWWGNILWL